MGRLIVTTAVTFCMLATLATAQVAYRIRLNIPGIRP